MFDRLKDKMSFQNKLKLLLPVLMCVGVYNMMLYLTLMLILLGLLLKMQASSFVPILAEVSDVFMKTWRTSVRMGTKLGCRVIFINR